MPDLERRCETCVWGEPYEDVQTEGDPVVHCAFWQGPRQEYCALWSDEWPRGSMRTEEGVPGE